MGGAQAVAGEEDDRAACDTGGIGRHGVFEKLAAVLGDGLAAGDPIGASVPRPSHIGTDIEAVTPAGIRHIPGDGGDTQHGGGVQGADEAVGAGAETAVVTDPHIVSAGGHRVREAEVGAGGIVVPGQLFTRGIQQIAIGIGAPGGFGHQQTGRGDLNAKDILVTGCFQLPLGGGAGRDEGGGRQRVAMIIGSRSGLGEVMRGRQAAGAQRDDRRAGSDFGISRHGVMERLVTGLMARLLAGHPRGVAAPGPVLVGNHLEIELSALLRNLPRRRRHGEDIDAFLGRQAGDGVGAEAGVIGEARGRGAAPRSFDAQIVGARHQRSGNPGAQGVGRIGRVQDGTGFVGKLQRDRQIRAGLGGGAGIHIEHVDAEDYLAAAGGEDKPIDIACPFDDAAVRHRAADEFEGGGGGAGVAFVIRAVSEPIRGRIRDDGQIVLTVVGIRVFPFAPLRHVFIEKRPIDVIPGRAHDRRPTGAAGSVPAVIFIAPGTPVVEQAQRMPDLMGNGVGATVFILVERPARRAVAERTDVGHAPRPISGRIRGGDDAMHPSGDRGGIEDRPVRGDVDGKGSEILRHPLPHIGDEGRVVRVGMRLRHNGPAMVPLGMGDGFSVEITINHMRSARQAVENRRSEGHPGGHGRARWRRLRAPGHALGHAIAAARRTAQERGDLGLLHRPIPILRHSGESESDGFPLEKQFRLQTARLTQCRLETSRRLEEAHSE